MKYIVRWVYELETPVGVVWTGTKYIGSSLAAAESYVEHVANCRDDVTICIVSI